MPDACLSVLEILRAPDDLDARRNEHLLECPRCRALQRMLLPVPPSLPATETPPAGAGGSRRANPTSDAVDPGSIWVVASEGCLNEVAVILDQTNNADGTVDVAPTSTTLLDATEFDLRIPSATSTLGYAFAVVVRARGSLSKARLERRIGELDEQQFERLRSLANSFRDGEALAMAADTGTPLQGPDDPRSIKLSLLLDRLNTAFIRSEHPDAPPTVAAEALPSIGSLIESAVGGPEWDEPTLAEEAHVSQQTLRAFRDDSLDLTDRRDLADLLKVVRVLRPANVLDLIRESLKRSPGGVRRGTGGAAALAARSFAHVSEEQRRLDLYRDQSEIDTSPEARASAVEAYLRDVEGELDD
jgi:mRNA-degrading endonuclease toxin of MazEF toxin-antitoxin module